MTNKRLLQVTVETDAWAANRKLYPGWIIAPCDSREALWDFTRFWIEPILSSLPDVSADQRLYLLDELNWRLETALLPLFTNIADATIRCLEELNPFPGSLDLPGASIRLTPDNSNSMDWPRIRSAWVRLALAVLRFSREERQGIVFEKWVNRLTPLLDEFPDGRQRLGYERCLAALGDMDDAQVRVSLGEWSASEHDPVWQIRRASILAEIGELREAEVLVEASLLTLRIGSPRTSDDVGYLSREGWAMLLLMGLKQHNWLMGKEHRPDYRGRLEQLGKYHCNPRSELDLFETKLEQPVPRPAPRTTLRPEFYSSGYSRSYHGGENVGAKLIPAYQFMRLTEEAPYPSRCGNTVLSAGNLKRAAEWFARHDVVRTLTILYRLASVEVAESFLTRHRVAALPMNSIKEFHGICIRVIRDLHQRVLGGGCSDAGVAERALRQLETGIEILSRIAVRLPENQLEEVLSLAIKLYNLPATRSSTSLPGRVCHLLHSLIRTLPAPSLALKISQLIALPIPGSTTFPVAIPQLWTEPIHYCLPRAVTIPRKPRDKQWNEAVESLLACAASEPSEVRGRALTRLALLHAWGCLTEAESRRLGSVLWRKTNTQTRLPDMVGLQNWACLSLPEPRKGLAAERLREYLGKADLLRYCQQVPGPDGKARRSFTMYVNADAYLLDWLGGTHPGSGRSEDRGRKHFNPTRREVSALLAKIRTWWEQEGKDLWTNPIDSPFAGPMSIEPSQSRMRYIFQVLDQIVIPRVPRGSTLAIQILAFVRQLDEAKVPTEEVLPALLFLDPKDAQATASRLRHSLVTADEPRQLAALRGLLSWLRNETRDSRSANVAAFPRLPNDLLQELCSIIASRRQPGLRIVMEAVAGLLRDYPQRLHRRLVNSLVVGLDYLLTETQYRSEDDHVGNITFDEIPIYRNLAARIAGLLASRLGNRSKVVQQWIDTARQDPLPEIRQAVE